MKGWLQTVLSRWYPWKPSNTEEKGAWGEHAARVFLEDRGYQFLLSNFKSSAGEIDLIMQKEHALIFVEVKTRSPGRIRPMAAVNQAKRRRIIKTAMVYLRTLKNSRQRVRFDIVEVYLEEGRLSNIHHVAGAFEMSPLVDFG